MAVWIENKAFVMTKYWCWLLQLFCCFCNAKITINRCRFGVCFVYIFTVNWMHSTHAIIACKQNPTTHSLRLLRECETRYWRLGINMYTHGVSISENLIKLIEYAYSTPLTCPHDLKMRKMFARNRTMECAPHVTPCSNSHFLVRPPPPPPLDRAHENWLHAKYGSCIDNESRYLAKQPKCILVYSIFFLYSSLHFPSSHALSPLWPIEFH